MERRAFFRLGLDRALNALLSTADAATQKETARWFRPPFALRELSFQLACTRCDKCIEACPHQVLFRLPMEYGVRAAGTPAMDLLTRGCHLCADWPCVNVCEPGALKRPVMPEGEGIPPPVLARARIDARHCLPYQGPECGACNNVCPVPGALTWDGPRPVIHENLCTGCALCREVCITTPKAVGVDTLIQRNEGADATVA